MTNSVRGCINSHLFGIETKFMLHDIPLVFKIFSITDLHLINIMLYYISFNKSIVI